MFEITGYIPMPNVARIKKTQRRRLQRAIRRLIAAEINDAFRGAAHPDEWVYVDAELKAAKKNMTKVLNEVL
jgi:hypothetical protein